MAQCILNHSNYHINLYEYLCLSMNISYAPRKPIYCWRILFNCCICFVHCIAYRLELRPDYNNNYLNEKINKNKIISNKLCWTVVCGFQMFGFYEWWRQKHHIFLSKIRQDMQPFHLGVLISTNEKRKINVFPHACTSSWLSSMTEHQITNRKEKTNWNKHLNCQCVIALER